MKNDPDCRCVDCGCDEKRDSRLKAEFIRLEDKHPNANFYRVLPDKFTLVACAVALAIVLIVLITAR